MSERIEKIMQKYPQMVMERTCLENQIKNFKGIAEAEIIESITFTQPNGERVQTSGVSDKTARIAMSYHEKMDRINKEWYEYLQKKYVMLSEELRFFESAVHSLSGKLAAVMSDMVFERMTWDALAEKYFVSQRMIGKYRKKAIAELDTLYAAYDRKLADYILS